jgi:sensor domain CHASE-containing protein
MSWPIPSGGRGLVTIAALLIPLALVIALLPSLAAWPLLPAARQRRLHQLVKLVLTWTAEIARRARTPRA